MLLLMLLQLLLLLLPAAAAAASLRLGEVAESDEAGARHGTMKRSIALIVARVAELHYHAPSRSPAPGQIVQVRVNMRSTWRDEAG